MAKIPVYNVDRSQLTTESPTAPIDPSKVAALGQEVGSIGEGLEAFGQHMQKLQDAQQIAAGKNLLAKALDKIYINSLKDPDVWGQPDKVDGDYQKAIDEASSHITSNEARIKFQDEAQLIADRKRTSLTMALYNKQSQLYKGTFVDTLDTLQDEYLKSTDPADHSILKNEMLNETQKAIGIGGVNPAYAQLHLKKILEGLGEKLLDSDLGIVNDNPKAIESTIAEIKKGDSGRYKDIPIEKREKALVEAERVKKRADKIQEERVRNINHVSDKQATWKYANGSLTQDDLFKSANKMTKERYDLLSANLKNNNIAYEPHPYEFADMIDFISDEKNSERDVVNKILEKENSGKLTALEAHDLVKMFMISPDQDPVSKLPQRPDLNQMLEAQEKKNDAHTEKANNWGIINNIFHTHFGEQPKIDSSQFETKLSPQEENKFQEWKKKYAPKDSGADYDLRGAFKEGLTPNAQTGHWPDKYKKPNHPTFSNESKYATGEYAKSAGHWEGDKYVVAVKQVIKNYHAEQNQSAKDTREWAQAQAKKVVNEDVIKSNPYVAQIPKEGKMMIDSKGNKAIVYPDGSYKELQ